MVTVHFTVFAITSGREHRREADFNVKLLHSVFLPALITDTICFGEEDNSQLVKNLVNNEH